MDNLLVPKRTPPPARKKIVPRPLLIQKLTEEWQQGKQLTLVSAPAGYGKTTLVAEWLRCLAIRPAWLTLDEADNDPVRFLKYLIATLEPAIGQFPAGAREALQASPPGSAEAVLTALINAITEAPEALILILDDYHAIHNPAVHLQLAFLLEHPPARLHLVIVTREDPLLPVARLRARGQLLEIRQADLRFSLAECAEFLRHVMGLSLAEDDIAALERRTEGWAAGLQLAAIALQSPLGAQSPLSMRGRSDLSNFIQAFTGSSRFILDYLMDEVFDRQAPEVQDFLVKTSVLERLSGPLCDAVVERSGSQALLEHLEQANLFIFPLDQERAWYRYHPLFSELLRYRLLRTLGVVPETALHLRASLWYEVEGYPSEAIRHALEARDWERAAALVEQAGDAQLKRGETVTLIGWCEKLPPERLLSRPRLGLGYAWAASLLGQFAKAVNLLSQLEALAVSIPPLMGQVAAVQAFIARGQGDNDRAIEKSQQALALLPASEAQTRGILAVNLGLVYWHAGRLAEAGRTLNAVIEVARQTGNRYAALTAQIFLARTLASQGELRRAEGLYQQILLEGENVPILALAQYDLSTLYYEWNDLAKAGEHLEKGLELCTRSGNVEFQNSGHLQKAYLWLARGEPGRALAEVEISHALARDFNPATRSRSAACHAQIALAAGDVDTAARWLAQRSEEVDAHSFYRFIGLGRARLLIAQGEKAAARTLLEECLTRAERAGCGYVLVAIRALQALAQEKQETALAILGEALQSSQREGFIRSYVDAGPALVPFLQEAARRALAPAEYIGQILPGFGGRRKQEGAADFPLVEPLSERELEVLRLVVAGLSNREIARRLVISAGTAKTHLHHLFGKLGVRNRTEATVRALELGLVSQAKK